MTPEVESAIEEIRQAFADHEVEVDPEDQGGAYVAVQDLTIGSGYRPRRSWIAFLIPYLYPRADVYPHFMDPEVQRADGGELGSAFQRTTWRGRPVIQVSRKSNRWNPAVDTAATKLATVLDWIRTR